MSERLQVPGPDDRSIEVLVGGDPDGLGLLSHGGSPSAVAEWAVLIAMGATESAPRRGPLARLLNPGAPASDQEG